MRTRQPYLINPHKTANPFELVSVAPRRFVAETDERGRFKRVKSLTHKTGKAKKLSRAAGLALLSGKVTRSVRKAAKRGKLRGAAKAAFLARMAKGRKSIAKTTRKGHKLHNPIMVVNPIRRIRAMRKYSRHTRRTHRNPIGGLLKGSGAGSNIGNLVLDGAMLVAGSVGSNLAMDTLAKHVSFFAKPWVKVGGYVALSAAVYYGGSKIKKLPRKVTEMLALGAMIPAIQDGYKLVREQASGIKSLPAPAPATTGAYVPATGAYVPEVGAYVPQTGLSYGEEYTA